MIAEQLREIYRQYRQQGANPLGDTPEQKAGCLLMGRTVEQALAALDQRDQRQQTFCEANNIRPNPGNTRSMGLELDFAEVRALLEAARGTE